jgi:hypothetical protein
MQITRNSIEIAAGQRERGNLLVYTSSTLEADLQATPRVSQD